MREIPVLLYHNIGRYPEKMMEDGILPETFEVQVKYLKENGYNIVGLKEAVDHLSGLEKLPPKSISLTIDGGYEDAFENVFPILKAYDVKATFFIPAETVGNERIIKGEAIKCMDWDQINNIAQNGIEIGLLAHNGRPIRGDLYDEEAIKKSVLAGLETLEKQMNTKVKYCAFKEGFPEPPLWEFLQGKGIEAVFTQCPTHRKTQIDGIGRIQVDDDDQNIFYTKISAFYLFFKDKKAWQYIRRFKIDRVAHRISETWNWLKGE